MLQLHLGSKYVGSIDDVLEDQGTFFGDFQLDLHCEMDAEWERVISFIDFCRSWFEAQSKSTPPDASAFDKYSDVIAHGSWKIIDESKQTYLIADAPMFNGGRSGELSWVLADK